MSTQSPRSRSTLALVVNVVPSPGGWTTSVAIANGWLAPKIPTDSRSEHATFEEALAELALKLRRDFAGEDLTLLVPVPGEEEQIFRSVDSAMVYLRERPRA